MDAQTITHRLQTLRFKLSKGDTKRVVEILGDVKKVSNKKLAEVAKSLNIDRPKLEYFHQIFNEYSEQEIAICQQAAQWIAAKTLAALDSELVFMQCLEPIIDMAVDGEACRVRVDVTPWDMSTHGVRTGKPHDWSRFHTFADFFEEPNGNTQATYTSGCGLYAQTLESNVQEEIQSVQYRIMRLTAKNAQLEAPAAIREWITTLSTKQLDEFLMEDVYEIMEEKRSWMFEQIGKIAKMNFLDTLERFSLESKKRVKQARRDSH